LDARWAGTLARYYTPSRYLFHTIQMASAYVGQVSPGSTITNCHYFQMADSLRWLSHTAYRTKELSMVFADKGFGTDERSYWETDPVWQGFRELMEKALTVWDWGEAIVVLNLVAKPAIEEAVLRKLGESARHNGDTLLGLLTDAQLLDSNRHRRWLAAFTKMALETPGNLELMRGWVAKWEPLADAAIEAYVGKLPHVADGAASAKAATRQLRQSMGL
jgi:toluene monooxygenase system protein E